jgi:6-pyruvoyltetrahydropterin/6-carboxytetrahydropterin synthase
MFTITVETHFWASHQLALPDGSKEPPHFHNWLVTADVSSEKLNDMAVVMDFHRLKKLLEDITAPFDNKALNRAPCFQKNNPSAENVAKYIYDTLKSRLPQEVRLRSVKVLEQPGCAAKFGE